ASSSVRRALTRPAGHLPPKTLRPANSCRPPPGLRGNGLAIVRAPGGMVMKLYQFPFSPNSQKVVAFAYEVGVPLTKQTVNLFKGETRTPEMLAKNPNGKVPILEDGEFVLWESNAILGYLAGVAGRADLAPTGVRERAE